MKNLVVREIPGEAIAICIDLNQWRIYLKELQGKEGGCTI